MPRITRYVSFPPVFPVPRRSLMPTARESSSPLGSSSPENASLTSGPDLNPPRVHFTPPRWLRSVSILATLVLYFPVWPDSEEPPCSTTSTCALTSDSIEDLAASTSVVTPSSSGHRAIRSSNRRTSSSRPVSSASSRARGLLLTFMPTLPGSETSVPGISESAAAYWHIALRSCRRPPGFPLGTCHSPSQKLPPVRQHHR